MSAIGGKADLSGRGDFGSGRRAALTARMGGGPARAAEGQLAVLVWRDFELFYLRRRGRDCDFRLGQL
jgi:hypothetical protein